MVPIFWATLYKHIHGAPRCPWMHNLCLPLPPLPHYLHNSQRIYANLRIELGGSCLPLPPSARDDANEYIYFRAKMPPQS